MVKTFFSDTRPLLVKKRSRGKTGERHYFLNFNIEETEGGYSSESAFISIDRDLTQEDYGLVVSAIVRSRYSQDEVEAIVNNYLYSKTDEHKSEWRDLQEWRARAKEIATEILNEIVK